MIRRGNLSPSVASSKESADINVATEKSFFYIVLAFPCLALVAFMIYALAK